MFNNLNNALLRPRVYYTSANNQKNHEEAEKIMKNTVKKIFALAFLLITTIVVAGQNDALLAFSTKGPDRYADGTPVQVGEAYALVWSRTGSEFAGVDMNGQAVDPVNNAVVVALPLAKAKRNGDVHCPLTMFQIDAAFAASHADGAFALVLLDTRVANANGELVATGKLGQVNGWGFVEKSRVKAMGGSLVAATNAGDANGRTQTTATSAVPAGEDIPQPKITGIQVLDDNVVLTVTGTNPRLLYNIAAGAKPGRFTNRHAAHAAVPGHANRTREITIVVPKVAGQNFFQVVRN